jgi:hypothetical protein
MKRTIPLALLLLTLQGCLNYEQKTTLEENGSGSMEIHYWMSERMFMWMKDGTLAFNEDSVRKQYDIEGITIQSARTVSEAEDSTLHVWVELAFDDLTRLPECKGFKDLTFLWQREGDVFRFEQGIPMANNAEDSFLDDFAFTYTYVFPGTIRECDADTIDGNRAVWVFPLSKLNADVRLTATIEASSGRSVYWVMGVIAIVLLLVLLTIRLRRK